MSAVVHGSALPASAIADLPEGADRLELRQLLLNSGAGALAWWAMRNSGLSAESFAAPLRDSYRSLSIRAALAERELERLFAAIHAAGAQVILGKGWSVARAYPDPGLRPYGDFDLYVTPDDASSVRRLLAAVPLTTFSVDLHSGGSYLSDRPFRALLERTALVPLGTTKVRVFSPEDHLRLVCLHALAEGVIRPPWLCDIAFLLQRVDSTFDWDCFAAGQSRLTAWAFAAIGLAHQVLAVDVSAVPNVAGVRSQPRWISRTVLETWGEGPPPKGSRMPMAEASKGGLTRKALFSRWPNAIEATFGVSGAVNEFPRLPYQLAECVRRVLRFARSRNE